MIIIEDVLVSDTLLESYFHCNLKACKGACCVNGDEGAILEEHEAGILDDIYEDVKDYLTEKGREAIENSGKYMLHDGNKLRTPLIEGKACAFVNYEDQIALCGIEKAYLDGKIDFQKPVSCHLYPARTLDLGEYTALNYEVWEICSPACQFGKEKDMPLYRFLKDSLKRKFGDSFYEALEATWEHLEKEKGEL